MQVGEGKPLQVSIRMRSSCKWHDEMSKDDGDHRILHTMRHVRSETGIKCIRINQLLVSLPIRFIAQSKQKKRRKPLG